VLEYSIRKHATQHVSIMRLDRQFMIEQGWYTRPIDEPASTEFAFTRFFVPWLNLYSGRAMFVDCDFLFTADIAKLFEATPNYASVSVVKHDYKPGEMVKMDGQAQVAYHKKNWSSLMLFNCETAACRRLTLEYLNAASAMELHQFKWCPSSFVGSLPADWNWLEGHDEPQVTPPKGIHFTRGGPWLKDCVIAPEDIDYAELWYKYRAEMR